MNRRQLLLRTVLLSGASLAGARLARAADTQGAMASTTSALDADQSALIAQLSETILPQTDTPGAIEAGVPTFIERVVTEWYTPTERSIFLEGLAALERECRHRFGIGFVDSTATQREQVLLHFESLAAKAPGDTKPFFSKLKQLTVLGYYTSQVGATQELRYNPVPGRYAGSVKFSDVNRQYSY